MRKIFLYFFIYQLIITISPAQSIPAFIYNPLGFMFGLFFNQKKGKEPQIDIDSLVNSSQALEHSKIENYLKQLPTLTSVDTRKNSTWEHTLKRNLEGKKPTTGLPGDYKIIIDNILQDSENAEQVERIIYYLKTKHSHILSLLEQQIATAYVGNVSSLLNIARSKMEEETITTMSVRYLLDTKRQRIDYISTILLQTFDPNMINQAVQIHHSAKLESQDSIKLSLEHYLGFDDSTFYETENLDDFTEECNPNKFNKLTLKIKTK